MESETVFKLFPDLKIMKRVLPLILILSLLFIGCFEKSGMKVTSEAFKDGEFIPEKYTCDGENINPPLNFSNVPEKAKSLVIIMEDPDAPGGTFTHWIVWNIPASVEGIREGENISYPQGRNDFGKIGYGGPCPPEGSVHRYYFKVYALDTFLDLQEGSTKDDLINAMSGHVLDKAMLMGKYER